MMHCDALIALANDQKLWVESSILTSEYRWSLCHTLFVHNKADFWLFAAWCWLTLVTLTSGNIGEEWEEDWHSASHWCRWPLLGEVNENHGTTAFPRRADLQAFGWWDVCLFTGLVHCSLGMAWLKPISNLVSKFAVRFLLLDTRWCQKYPKFWLVKLSQSQTQTHFMSGPWNMVKGKGVGPLSPKWDIRTYLTW